tara:strand:- start:754 stop:858 length:105 start_codon:yes stop_codon:yes gene_type:complete
MVVNDNDENSSPLGVIFVVGFFILYVVLWIIANI